MVDWAAEPRGRIAGACDHRRELRSRCLGLVPVVVAVAQEAKSSGVAWVVFVARGTGCLVVAGSFGLRAGRKRCGLLEVVWFVDRMVVRSLDDCHMAGLLPGVRLAVGRLRSDLVFLHRMAVAQGSSVDSVQG
jgi:hypothetical protein